jgi:hypothetical protein
LSKFIICLRPSMKLEKLQFASIKRLTIKISTDAHQDFSIFYVGISLLLVELEIPCMNACCFAVLWRGKITAIWNLNELNSIKKLGFELARKLLIFTTFYCTEMPEVTSHVCVDRNSKSRLFCAIKTSVLKFCARKKCKNLTKNHLIKR